MDHPAWRFQYFGGDWLLEPVKYTDWQGTMEFTFQYPKSFPEETMREICREVVKIVAPQ